MSCSSACRSAALRLPAGSARVGPGAAVQVTAPVAAASAPFATMHGVEYSQITYDVRGDVAVITLNRPERLNAWTPTMAEEQVDAITRANDDPDVGAIVTTGAGRGFCAGADMQDTFQARIDGSDPGNDTAGGRGGMPRGVDWVQFVRAAKPMVAAINGPAVGIGVTMCLPMDQIVTTPGAKFGMGFIKMGLVPELASSRLLAERIGFGRASDLCLSGRIILGEEAHAIGLADRVSGRDDVVDVAVEIASSYAANPAPQLRMIKHLLTANAVESDLSAVQRAEHEYLLRCWESSQHAEAVKAFTEKRQPVFTR